MGTSSHFGIPHSPLVGQELFHTERRDPRMAWKDQGLWMGPCWKLEPALTLWKACSPANCCGFEGPEHPAFAATKYLLSTCLAASVRRSEDGGSPFPDWESSLRPDVPCKKQRVSSSASGRQPIVKSGEISIYTGTGLLY